MLLARLGRQEFCRWRWCWRWWKGSNGRIWSFDELRRNWDQLFEGCKRLNWPQTVAVICFFYKVCHELRVAVTASPGRVIYFQLPSSFFA